ncbi:hypothetical protein SAMD00019534_086450 [Acytostelium subglobosum LB1]|uniref:hypothetical protein n=1 Tax=Acytostelium subglobosum LB1 TaxID=1410327 RepID=UPI000644A58B|nr:hypothetical protein SAMD00019534_086450 [Acytostelium subglobosum LB1]GAM25470.1 hypothetical protein SAMD00019534_086450 [Acytostelium subglobosum LB1]|eukprot:XP_012751456.1 hypothetical protein SAMD00019534_086450 [Acytostelium subglobosum LB1]
MIYVFFDNLPSMVGIVDLYKTSADQSLPIHKRYDFRFIASNKATKETLGKFSPIKDVVKKTLDGYLAREELELPEYFLTLWTKNMVKCLKNGKMVKFSYPRYVHSGYVPKEDDLFTDQVIWKRCTIDMMGRSSTGAPRFYFMAEEVIKEGVTKYKTLALEREYRNKLESLQSNIEQRVDHCTEIRLKYILESIPQIVWVTDSRGVIEFVNRKWIDFLGVDAPGQRLSWASLASDVSGSGEATDRLWVDCLVNTKRFEAEILLNSPAGGSDRWFLVRAEPYRETSGGPVRWIGSCTDTHDQKTAQDRIEKAEKCKAIFLQTMSHEMRTPLAGIIGMNSWLISSETLSSDQLDCCKTVNMCADALLKLITNILDLSKLEENKITLEEAEFTPNKIVEDSVDIVAALVEKKNLEIIYQIDFNTLPVVVGDYYRIIQVMTNLLSNSVKFTPEGGTIRVGCSFDPLSLSQSSSHLTSRHMGGRYGKIQFWVEDTGIGIPEAGREKLFQAFSQYDASMSRKYGGSGLGLAISKRLTQVLGGDIWFRSEPKKGSVFNFTVQVFFPDANNSPFLKCLAAVPARRSPLLPDPNILQQSPTMVSQSGNKQSQVILMTTRQEFAAMVTGWTREWELGTNVVTSIAEMSTVIDELKANVQVGKKLDVAFLIDEPEWKNVAEDSSQQDLLVRYTNDTNTNFKPILVGYNKPSQLMPLLKRPIKNKTLREMLETNLLYFTKSNAIELPPIITFQSPGSLASLGGGGGGGDALSHEQQQQQLQIQQQQQHQQSRPNPQVKHRLDEDDNEEESDDTFDDSSPVPTFKRARRCSPLAIYDSISCNFSPSPLIQSPGLVLPQFTFDSSQSPNRKNSFNLDNEVPLEQIGGKYPLKIMVAEDSLVNQKVAKRYLTRMGYDGDEIVFVVNGKEAVEYLEKNEMVDVVLMDMQMPELDGCGATSKIRQMFPNSGPHIVGMTANAFSEDKDKCLLSGMCQYLAKPVKLEDLALELKRAWFTRKDFRVCMCKVL